MLLTTLAKDIRQEVKYVNEVSKSGVGEKEIIQGFNVFLQLHMDAKELGAI